MDDDSRDLAPGAVPPAKGFLEALSAPRRRSVDEHMFTVLAPSGFPATCRLQLFTAARARPVAVVTQVSGEGMALTNAAEAFVNAVWEQHCPDEELPPVWVQLQLRGDGGPGLEGFQRVRFTESERFGVRGPRWTGVSPQQLETLVGSPVEADRGSGFIPHPEEPEPQLRFEECAVVRLARPQPFRAPDCMPAGTGRWRRWMRQAMPRHGTGARDCCWYHGGDWHVVSAMALDVLKQARTQGIDAEDMEQYAVEHEAAAGATEWETEALATLFSTADAIQPDSSGTGYINGQHRAQAMFDAGVHRTVVMRTTWEP
ncbi:hypothetical protein [Streptomyces lydicus]|uniref:hypothetical protein n=1 Tax=Streptomyces lydicus TaxID=47763 RepID=UPI001010B0BD|nr:hypothetical protein [Streptomyces lydicus]MCZ1011913.1 hypothetical protein [Streptomyces lydicus]